jgi:hypothetical protein
MSVLSGAPDMHATTQQPRRFHVTDERFDVKAAVRFFGGPAELARRASASGPALSVKAIEKWQERGSIPGVWLVRLSQLARREERIFEIHDFMNKEKSA